MSATPLFDVWEASAGSPYTPGVSKERQFAVGATLLFLSKSDDGRASYLPQLTQPQVLFLVDSLH
jgi:hypothetical protein